MKTYLITYVLVSRLTRRRMGKAQTVAVSTEEDSLKDVERDFEQARLTPSTLAKVVDLREA